MKPKTQGPRILILLVAALAPMLGLTQGRLDRLFEEGGPLLSAQPLAALQNKAIQDELKLSDGQRSDILAVRTKLVEDLQAKIANARRNPLRANPSKLRKEAAEMFEGATGRAIAKLTPSQSRRLVEVCVQIGGSIAAANPLVQKDLNLSSKQKENIDSALKAAGKSARERQAKPSDAEIHQLQSRIEDVLSAEQLRILRGMGGAPFRLPDSDRQ